MIASWLPGQATGKHQDLRMFIYCDKIVKHNFGVSETQEILD